jgi:MFS family permease
MPRRRPATTARRATKSEGKAARTATPRLAGGIWVLGFVSLLMDTSSEMIHSLLPVFMVSVLGASALTVGLVEGVAEATAMIVKVFSGALSDYLGRRKPLAVVGYGLAAFSKPLFAIAASSGMVLTARFLEMRSWRISRPQLCAEPRSGCARRWTAPARSAAPSSPSD